MKKRDRIFQLETVLFALIKTVGHGNPDATLAALEHAKMVLAQSEDRKRFFRDA